jgi:hypothetical protein
MRLARCEYQRASGWTNLPDGSFDGASTLVLLFGASRLATGDATAALRRVLPRAILVGCSTAGEIHHRHVKDDSIAAAVIQLERSRLQLAVAPVPCEAASVHAGEQIAKELAAPDLRGILVLSEGLGVNGSALSRGLDAQRSSVVITGGLAADGGAFESTWVLVDDKPAARVVTAVGFYGEHLHLGHGSKGGWDIFGPERVVTRSEGNVLYELDGKPALALYKEYLGERANELPGAALLFPLAILRDDNSRLVRTVLSVDNAQQSMRFAGDVPQGARTELMRANFDRLVMGASDAALAAAHATAEPVLAIAISCVGRRLVLGGRIEEEVEATLDVLPPHAEQIGFYSYGELSSAYAGSCELHNQTMTLTTICEDVVR